MRKFLATVATAAILATPAAAQMTGEKISFPLGAGDPHNRVEFVTRTKNTNYFSETSVKHSVQAANVVFFDIINGRLDTENITQYNYVRFYMANCDTMTYSLYAQTEGALWDFTDNMTYATSVIGGHFGGTTPEGIRAGEICRDTLLLFR